MKGYDSIEHIEYIIENYNGPILEAFNMEKKKKEIQVAKKGFIRYLDNKYPDFDPKEITGAKTEAEKNAVKNKYKKDYEFWYKTNIKSNVLFSAELINSFLPLGISAIMDIVLFGASIDTLRKIVKEKRIDRRNEK